VTSSTSYSVSINVIPRTRALLQTNKLNTTWCRYLQPRRSQLWIEFTPGERQHARGVIDSYFASLADAPAQDFNLLFFWSYDQQGSNFLTKIPPTYKLKLEAPPWLTVAGTLGTLLDAEAKALRYDHKQGGALDTLSIRK
jgi:hypothetical protein